jgi:hypothetical protein
MTPSSIVIGGRISWRKSNNGTLLQGRVSRTAACARLNQALMSAFGRKRPFRSDSESPLRREVCPPRRWPGDPACQDFRIPGFRPGATRRGGGPLAPSAPSQPTPVRLCPTPSRDPAWPSRDAWKCDGNTRRGSVPVGFKGSSGISHRCGPGVFLRSIRIAVTATVI